jgi:hypothetical protein
MEMRPFLTKVTMGIRVKVKKIIAAGGRRHSPRSDLPLRELDKVRSDSDHVSQSGRAKRPSASMSPDALARLAAQESWNFELILFNSTLLIGAAAMCIDRRLRPLRGRGMLRAFAIFGMHRIGLLRRPMGLPRRGLRHGMRHSALAWRGRRSRLFLAANSK